MQKIQEALPALDAALTSAQAHDFSQAGLEDVQPFEVRVTMFPQLWGSTATGYGGLGGSAMTWAHTAILEVRGVYLVYFSRGRLAYWVATPEKADQVRPTQEQFDLFCSHLQSKSLAGVRDAGLFYGAQLPPRPTPKA